MDPSFTSERSFGLDVIGQFGGVHMCDRDT